VQIITPNIAEAEEILQCAPIRNADEALGAARALVTKGVQVAVITQAERGACYAIESESAQFPALRVSIADTTGAGDSLTAMVIYGIVNGWEMSETLQMGLRLAAHTLRTAETVAQDLSLDLLYDVK
jgi:fructose-1-phosphate kinase PfkB-like protein